MFFKHTLTVSALVSGIAALETHGGYEFDMRFTEAGEAVDEAIKDFYETTASKMAVERLVKRIQELEYETDCIGDDPNTDPASLYDYKDCLVAQDPNVFYHLFANDIKEANAFWETVISESTLSRTEWIPSRSIVRAYYDGDLTAPQFAAWMASPQADTGYLRGNAEHYAKSTENIDATTQSSHIFEGWGGVLSDKFGTYLTNFTVPDFAPREFGSDEYPAEWAIDPRYGPLQRAGPKTLQSGSVWGVLHIGVRDFEAEEGSTGKSGIEVYGAIWYPPWDQSSEENQAEFKDVFLKDEDYQIFSEVINFSLQAVEDCASGLCEIPT